MLDNKGNKMKKNLIVFTTVAFSMFVFIGCAQQPTPQTTTTAPAVVVPVQRHRTIQKVDSGYNNGRSIQKVSPSYNSGGSIQKVSPSHNNGGGIQKVEPSSGGHSIQKVR